VRRSAAVGLGVLALLALAGCGTGGIVEESSSGNGRQLFIEKCGGCHTLADAGTRGVIGPNLDDAFAVPIEEGFDQSTVLEVVLGQMRFPVAPMPQPDSAQMFPSSKYTDEEREQAMQSIASYVASVAGRPPSGGGAAAGGGATTGGGQTTTGATTTGGQTTTGGKTTTGGAAAGGAEAKALFTANCAACHTLSAAGSSGTVGPNLDQSTKDLAAIGQQITNGGGGMPPFKGTLTDAQIQALAKWVADNRKK
jgi:mono/diheme cytochrome c family protein